MSDELTRAIAEALGCDALVDAEGDYYCSEHGEYLDHNGRCPEAVRIVAALAPLIEARVREARADEVTQLAAFLRDDVAEWMTKRAEEVRRG